MAPGWYSREFCVLSAQLWVVIRGLFNFHKVVLGTSTQLAWQEGITITGSSLTASQQNSSNLISDFLGLFVGRGCRACWVASFLISQMSCHGKKHAFQTRLHMHSGMCACTRLFSLPNFHHGRTVDARGKVVWDHLVGKPQSALLQLWIIQI